MWENPRGRGFLYREWGLWSALASLPETVASAAEDGMLPTGLCPIPGHKRNDPTSRPLLTVSSCSCPLPHIFTHGSLPAPQMQLDGPWGSPQDAPVELLPTLPAATGFPAPSVLSLLAKRQVKPMPTAGQGTLSRVDPPQPGPAA